MSVQGNYTIFASYHYNMKTKDEILKIEATLLYILKFFPEGLDFIKIFKLLYFSQRSYLVAYGRPIIPETFYAIRKGPVPSFSYKAFQCILGEQEETAEMKSFLSAFDVEEREDNIRYVIAKKMPDMDELSGSEQKFIDKVIALYKDKTSAELSNLSHDVAWESAIKRAKRDPEKNIISQIDMAKAGGATKEMLNYIRESQCLKRNLSL